MCVPFVCFFSIITSTSPHPARLCPPTWSQPWSQPWSLKRPTPDREGLPEAADGVPVEEGRRQEGRVQMGAEPRPRIQDPQRGKVHPRYQMVTTTR